VATRVGGLVDAIEDGITGVLVEPGDPGALRTTITGLLAAPDVRARLGAAARSAAAARWSARASCESLQHALRAAGGTSTFEA
jgi:glycosyltransferase involved in cell wall biosynthesis